MRLTQGPKSEASTQEWAKQTLQTLEDHWACHRASAPELSGAQVNFFIEMQRAVERYLRCCDDREGTARRDWDDQGF